MKWRCLWALPLIGLSAVCAHAETPVPPTFATQFITVEKDVRLEVVDWGGAGRPLILLAPLGAGAHGFDSFAPKLTTVFHVFGISRRGFGGSSIPDSGYSADRLGDDVVAVIDVLGLKRPILVGHSIAGEELSSVGFRYPEKVAGLVYLEAGYSFALYDTEHGDLTIDSLELKRQLGGLLPGGGRPDQKRLTEELIRSVAQIQKDLLDRRKELQDQPDIPRPAPGWKPPVIPVPILGILSGMQRYTELGPVPVLAIFAVPHDLSDMFKGNPEGQAKAEADDLAKTEAQAAAFAREVPHARVVRIPHASHAIFDSNEADVLREIFAFERALSAVPVVTPSAAKSGAQ
ncbi:MAG TPA: alpha/beta hydrolase [Opitutaceae bacterium]